MTKDTKCNGDNVHTFSEKWHVSCVGWREKSFFLQTCSTKWSITEYPQDKEIQINSLGVSNGPALRGHRFI